MFFSLLLTFYHSIVFQCIYVIIIISIKHFVDIKIFCKIHFIVLTMAWAENFYKCINIFYKFDLLFKNGPLKFFEDCFSQILLGPFLNTLP